MTISIRSLALVVVSWGASSGSLAGAQASTNVRPPAGAGALEIGDPYFPGLGNGGYDVEHYALELAVDMDTDAITATARIRARALQDLAAFSLDLYGLEVQRVRVDGQDARFERPAPTEGASGKPTELVLHPAAPLAAGAAFTAEVAYGGSPAGRPDPAFAFLPGAPGSGWRRLGSGVYVTSQCIGASSWFPCNDHPRDKATYSFRVTVQRPWTAAANGL
ncbi:MAG TPA: M1 family peptidase, partial [Planctomycetota bacterium]